MGNAAHNATGVSKTFTIRNDGDQTLTLTTPFADTTYFTVSDPTKTTLAAGESTTFTVMLVTSDVWTGSETISLTNSDTDEGTFTFVVSGTVTALPSDITILDGNTVLTDGQTTAINVGNAAHNATGASKTFTIRNDGDQTLTLTTPFADTTHFTVSDPRNDHAGGRRIDHVHRNACYERRLDRRRDNLARHQPTRTRIRIRSPFRAR